MASWLRRRRERPLDCLRLGAAMGNQIQLGNQFQRNHKTTIEPARALAEYGLLTSRKVCVWYEKQKTGVKDGLLARF